MHMQSKLCRIVRRCNLRGGGVTSADSNAFWINFKVSPQSQRCYVLCVLGQLTRVTTPIALIQTIFLQMHSIIIIS